MPAKTRYKWLIDATDDEGLEVEWIRCPYMDDEWGDYYDTKLLAKQAYIEEMIAGLNRGMSNIRIFKGRLEAAKKLQ